MIKMILMAALSQANPVSTPVKSIQGPCVWPHVCAQVAAALVQPCVWPNTCASQPAPVQPCVWPNTCAQVASGPVQTCVWPHKCA